jgi:hypothetical protein
MLKLHLNVWEIKKITGIERKKCVLFVFFLMERDDISKKKLLPIIPKNGPL